jgi:hypothetical protein
MLAAYMHVLVHHPLTLFEGKTVPGAGLDERVHEEVLALAGDYVAAALPTGGMFADVDRAPGKAEVRVGYREVFAQARLHEGGGHRLEGVEVVAYAPEHEVRVRAEAHKGEGPEQYAALVLLGGAQEFLLATLALLVREPAPLGVELEEEVVYVLGR